MDALCSATISAMAVAYIIEQREDKYMMSNSTLQVQSK